MITMNISLDSIEKIKSFVNTIAVYPYDFDLASGRYIVDAKSIMGISALICPSRSLLTFILLKMRKSSKKLWLPIRSDVTGD